MTPSKKSFLVIFPLLLIFLTAGMIKGTGTGTGTGTNSFHLLHKDEVQANSRKLLGVDKVIDYDFAGASQKHDPRGRRGGRSL